MDGADVCGDIVADEVGARGRSAGSRSRTLTAAPPPRGRRCNGQPHQITAALSKLGNVDRFSIIGYSMGGLIARYAIGKLLDAGAFKGIKLMVRARRPDAHASREALG